MTARTFSPSNSSVKSVTVPQCMLITGSLDFSKRDDMEIPDKYSILIARYS